MTTTPPAAEPGRLALSIKEAAAALGVGERLLRRQVAAGHVPGARIGRRVVVSREAVARLLAGESNRPAA